MIKIKIIFVNFLGFIFFYVYLESFAFFFSFHCANNAEILILICLRRRDGESSSSSSYLTAFKGLNVIDDGNRSIKNKMIFIKYLSKEKNDDKDDPIKLITSFQNIGINDVKYAKNVSFVILIIMILFNSGEIKTLYLTIINNNNYYNIY